MKNTEAEGTVETEEMRASEENSSTCLTSFHPPASEPCLFITTGLLADVSRGTQGGGIGVAQEVVRVETNWGKRGPSLNITLSFPLSLFPTLPVCRAALVGPWPCHQACLPAELSASHGSGWRFVAERVFLFCPHT